MTKTDELIQKMYENSGCCDKEQCKETLRLFLSEIQKGEVVATTEVIENGIRFNKVVLKPEYQRFLEEGK